MLTTKINSIETKAMIAVKTVKMSIFMQTSGVHLYSVSI